MTALLLQSVPGVLLQSAGAWWALRSGAAEVNLAIGVLLVALGTPWTVFVLERYAVRIGRADRWALAGLLGPVGPLIVARLEPRAPSADGDVADGSGAATEGPKARSRLDRAAGLALCVLITAGLGWGLVRWLAGAQGAPTVEPGTMERNEQLAYERLRQIAQAQQRYAERDWDGDGRKSYADFTVHLWQSVDAEGNPLPVELIGRELGFAMVHEFALDGYTFRSLHWQDASPTGSAQSNDGGTSRSSRAEPREPIDPEKTWAVVAEPVEAQKSGRLAMLVDSSQSIWIAPASARALELAPANPEANGWTRVQTAAELIAHQRASSQPSASPTRR